MRTLESSRFLKDLKRMGKRHQSINLLKDLVRRLTQGEPLSRKHHDHPLTGNWIGHRECHVQPDWLLIYRLEEQLYEGKFETVLMLVRTGSHADLFDM